MRSPVRHVAVLLVSAAGAAGAALSLAGAGRTEPPQPHQAPPVKAAEVESKVDVAQGNVGGHTDLDPLETDLNRRMTSDVRPLLAAYCLDCHAGEDAKGGIDLDAVASVRDALAIGGDLDLVREMVVTGEMPPRDKTGKPPLPRPSDHERLILQQWLEAAASYVPPDAEPDPGWFTIHRLNRSEYRNTLRDLLGVDPAKVDIAAKLPRDDTGYGFDNIADVLTVSPLAVEQYLDAAERAIEIGLGPVVTIGDSPRPVRPLISLSEGRLTGRGGFFLFANGAVNGDIDFPAAGEYIIRVVAWETHGGDENARLSLRIDDKEVGDFFISGTREKPEQVESRVRVRAGVRPIAAHFTNDYYVKDKADRNLAIESITVSGPISAESVERTAAWESMFGATADASQVTDESQRAGAILGGFASRAFRRPVSEDEREALAALYSREREQGRDFERAVRTAMAAVLVSPNFLYRSVDSAAVADSPSIYRLSGYELASRLSYFLWSSMPDDELLRLAADGSLVQDSVLAGQARRMLADPRADAFIENFSGQWLQLRTLDTLAMDRGKFPEYDEALKSALVTEARMYFGEIVRGDRSVMELVSSDWSVLNDRLAAYYGVADVPGPEFRRVALGPASPRGGVLTMGAVLTVTSNTTRTSPVKRGLYVLDQILGAPPPPPPADIPPLEQAATLDPEASLRERLAAHVANPTCAVCHNRLDPIGLALENFDAIGRWREQEGGKPIDATGTLPGGVRFDGPAELKKILLDRSDEFVQTLAGKVLMYAVGRGLEPFDRPAVRAIASRTREQGDRFGALVEAVVLSDTFRACRGREQARE
ncbi:MAG: hypothetical protein GIKADHBN_02683 [Phycisphaerales bacterium]|nr:hypothetical protein [Phycisphaerales bacterium]